MNVYLNVMAESQRKQQKPQNIKKTKQKTADFSS